MSFTVFKDDILSEISLESAQQLFGAAVRLVSIWFEIFHNSAQHFHGA